MMLPQSLILPMNEFELIKPMPGVFEVSRKVPLATAIEDILLIADYSLDDEWEGQVRYLPLR